MKVKEENREAYNRFVEVNSTDSYSHGVVKYMHWWADLMEVEMAQGKKLIDIAERAGQGNRRDRSGTGKDKGAGRGRCHEDQG